MVASNQPNLFCWLACQHVGYVYYFVCQHIGSIGSFCSSAQRLFAPVRAPEKFYGEAKWKPETIFEYLKVSRLQTFATGSLVKISMRSCFAGTQLSNIAVASVANMDVYSPNLVSAVQKSVSAGLRDL